MLLYQILGRSGVGSVLERVAWRPPGFQVGGLPQPGFIFISFSLLEKKDKTRNPQNAHIHARWKPSGPAVFNQVGLFPTTSI